MSWFGVLFFLILLTAVIYVASYRFPGHGYTRPEDPLEIVGAVGRAETTFAAEGKVLVKGELWKAISTRGIIERGEPIRVKELTNDLTLLVERIEPKE